MKARGEKARLNVRAFLAPLRAFDRLAYVGQPKKEGKAPWLLSLFGLSYSGLILRSNGMGFNAIGRVSVIANNGSSASVSIADAK